MKEIIEILKENNFLPSTRQDKIYFRDYGGMVIFADHRSGKLRFYGYSDGKAVPENIINNKVKLIKQLIEARAKGQQKLDI